MINKIDKDKFLTKAQLHLLEALAELEHEQWAHWTKYFLCNFCEANRLKWLKQIKTPYRSLTQIEKESDKEWARKVLSLIDQHKRFYAMFCECGHLKSEHFVDKANPSADYGCTCYNCRCIKFKEVKS